MRFCKLGCFVNLDNLLTIKGFFNADWVTKISDQPEEEPRNREGPYHGRNILARVSAIYPYEKKFIF